MSNRNIREVVATARTQGADALGSGKLKSHAETLVDFLARITAAAVTSPNTGLTSLLADLGFERIADDDESLSSSSASFVFNMDGSSTVSSFHGAKSKSQLTGFSTLLAHRSWVENNRDLFGAELDVDQDAVNKLMVAHRCGAAILFVDLSGYSKIAAALTQSGGAHALSAAVNAYFENILAIVVEQFDGEVLTFAGDAVVACFTAHTSNPDTAGRSACLRAAACALDLQRRCGMSPVQGTDLSFRLHIGITYGEIESHVFTCPASKVMQQAYHFVSGYPLKSTAAVVDAAKTGEICVTADVRRECGNFVHTTLRSPDGGKASGEPSSPLTPNRASDAVYQLHSIDDDYGGSVDLLSPEEKAAVRHSSWLETNLVPPSVTKKLRQGFKASHIAEMRFLCVMFIRKVDDDIGPAEWFSEVQQILDESRCPVVQVLDDDKGMHVIAAVNLYVAERNPASVGIVAARKLIDRETGCVIGMACGEVFCGITGATTACRWDITGPTCVLACRMMQHGLSVGLSTVFAESVFVNTNDLSMLDQLPEPVSLKGSPAPVPVFTLSATSISATAGIMSVAWASQLLHAQQREQLNAFLSSKFQRGVAVVSGPVGSGKKTLISLMLDRNGFTSIVYESTRDRQPLSVVRLLAEWFSYHQDEELAAAGRALTRSFRKQQVARTISLSLQLIRHVIAKGIHCCLVVAYAHLLDPASMTLIQTALQVAPAAPASAAGPGTGRFYFVLTAYMLYGAVPIDGIVSSLQRALTEYGHVIKRSRTDPASVQREVVHVKVPYATTVEEFKEGVHGVTYFHLTPRAAQVFFEATGGCLALIRPLDTIISANLQQVARWEAEHPDASPELRGLLAPFGIDGMMHITQQGEDYLYSEINWPRVEPGVSARFTELYDALPPRHQLILRIVASLSSVTGSANKYGVAITMSKLNPKITDETVYTDIETLKTLMILKTVTTDADEVGFTVPALIDIVGSLLTPDQDKFLKRSSYKTASEYYEKAVKEIDERPYEPDDDHMPVLASFVARLARSAGLDDVYRRLMLQSWTLTLQYTGDDGSKNPAMRRRMEDRLAMENRRNPTGLPESAFNSFAIKPLLRRWSSPEHLNSRNDITLVPEPMLLCRRWEFPIALGSISGELQKLLWELANRGLDRTKPASEVFIDDVTRKYIAVDLTAFCKALQAFDAVVPGASTTSTIADEQRFLENLMTLTHTAADATARVAEFYQYMDRAITPRRDRVVAFVETVTECAQVRHLTAAGAVKSALSLFMRPAPIPATAVHEALLRLATAGWKTKYYAVNLQSIRDAILFQRTATAMDFKAFLFCLSAFGDEITSAELRR